MDVGLIARDAAQQTPEYVKGSATGAITVTFVGPNLNIAYAMNAEFPQDPPSTVWRLERDLHRHGQHSLDLQCQQHGEGKQNRGR